jgi:hypothetical protein
MTTPAIAPRRPVRAILGVRWLDHATGEPVLGGLHAILAPANHTRAARNGVPGPSGIISFHRVSGMHDHEFPSEPARPTPAPNWYVLAVSDRQRRYLPAVYFIELPRLGSASFPGSLPAALHPQLSLPLYSAPNRIPPTGFATVRAQVRAFATGMPVPHAVVRVQLGTIEGDGVADREGRVLALIAPPMGNRLIAGSPPGTGQALLGRESWPVTIRVFADAGLAPPPVAPGPGSFPLIALDVALPHPWTDLPSARRILTQGQASIVLSFPPGVPDLPETILAGEDLVLRTMSTSDLMITAA